MPILFINCRLFPFVAWILSGFKTLETRNRNTLKNLVNQSVFLCQTGKGKKLVMGIATITEVITINSLEEFNRYRRQAMIKTGSVFDFNGKVKYLYRLENVQKIAPFEPEEGYHHGRIWMEYNGRKA